MPAPADRLVIALAQIHLDRRRHRGKSRAPARGARRGGRRSAPTSCWRPSSSRRLSARGSGAEARLPGSVPRRLRGARARHRRRRAGACSSACPGSRTARSTTPPRCSTAGASRRCASRSICRITACLTKSASSSPAPRRGRSSFAACASACPSARTSGAPSRSSASPRRAARSCSFPTPRPMSATSSRSASNVAVARVVESGLPLIYLNQVGGQDELVFEGASFALNADRSLAFQLPAFRRRAWRAPCGSAAQRAGAASRARRELVEEGDEADYAACVMGLRDYVDNNRFPGVVLGLSGGVDSALCAAMAVDALGAARVHCGDAALSLHLERIAARRRGLRARRSASATTSCRSPSRSKASSARSRRCSPGAPRDITEENIQSRARGLILMSISNKFGAMVVTTGNKSEMSVGYATLYGDMNGGFNPIKDLYKMEVFRLAALAQPLEAGRREGARRRGDPARTSSPAALGGVAREPEGRGFAAALSGARRASSSGLVEKEMRVADIIAEGFDAETVQQGRAAALSRRIQAPAVGAGRQGRPEEFRPRPALSDRQPLPRSGAPRQRPDASIAPRGRRGERAVRGVGGRAARRARCAKQTSVS